MLTDSPFEDLLTLFEQLPDLDRKAADDLQSYLSKKHSVFSEYEEDMVEWLSWLAAWQGKSKIGLRESHICLFSSSYEGGGDEKNAVEFADLAGKGVTPINHLCKDRGLGLRVLELAPSIPFSLDTPWTERECMAACAFGMEATAAGGDLLGLSAVSEGANDVAISLIEKIEALGSSESSDYSVLRCMQENAGREIAALVGAMLAARSRRLPVLVEGWAALAAMKVLHAVDSNAIAHVRVASVADAREQRVVSSFEQSTLLSPLNTLPSGCGVALAISALFPLIELAK